MVAQTVKHRLQSGRPGFDSWVWKISWRRKWQPTPVLLPGKSHGPRSLVGCSPWGHKELDMTDWLDFTSLQLDLNTSLLIKIRTIKINTFLPMRNKYYSCSIKIHASGFNEILESIFCILLVGEVFPLQKVVKMLKVLVGWWEVRWIWQVRQNFAVQFVQLLKHWLRDLQSSVVVEDWTIANSRRSFQGILSVCWAYCSDVMVSLGFKRL